ncbi:membrane protein insertase YidC [Spongiibacter sp. KMU-158]|uniref:Membrane protein insertase YidC n=1 Tax=Spongiibacter pelagi TaxID=2760804 RepID=A0A927C052_9GAMM|nr:membrane protein insertase YidC [Spongiibacter pelagi]
MDFQRYLLIAAIAALSLMLLVEWRNFELENSTPLSASATVDTSAQNPAEPAALTSNNEEMPSLQSASAALPDPVMKKASEQLISLSNDVLKLKIDPRGGDIVYSELEKFAAELHSKERFVLLENNGQRSFIAQSGLIGDNATDTAEGRPLFSANSNSKTLEEGSDEVVLDLHYAYSDSISIIKRFTLKRGEYQVRMDYLVNNLSDQPFNATLFTQLRRDNSTDPGASNNGGMFAMHPFLGVAYASNDDLYNKLRFEKMREKPLNQTVNGGWIAMVQHYFLNAWVPQQDSQNQLSTVVTQQSMNIARITQPGFSVAAGSQGGASAILYSGPKDQYRLEEIAPGLDLSVDYGWLWWIAQPIFWLLVKLHGFLGNWGLSIIAVTVLVKALFFQLNAKAFTSMANMRRVQPKLVELRERYANDKQKQSQAMMELYKKEKINPVGGCLPMVVQMPVFISLYWVLMESVELRHSPFMLWIHDLSSMDPYFVLPLIMGTTMFFQQKLNPPPPDPMQAKVMQWMPVIFTFFFLFFPAGLVLYWVVNNSLSILQQYIISKRIEKSGLPTR